MQDERLRWCRIIFSGLRASQDGAQRKALAPHELHGLLRELSANRAPTHFTTRTLPPAHLSVCLQDGKNEGEDGATNIKHSLGNKQVNIFDFCKKHGNKVKKSDVALCMDYFEFWTKSWWTEALQATLINRYCR